MTCPRCGNNLDEKSSYCVRCGYSFSTMNNNFNGSNGFVDNQNMDTSNSINNQSINNFDNAQNDLDLDELECIYIGKKYDRFSGGGFSWAFLFGGPVYAIYRKCYAFGLIVFALKCAVSIIFGILSLVLLRDLSFISSIIVIIIHLTAASMFKNYYVNLVDKRINEIISDCNGLSSDKIKNICSKNGGVHLWILIVFYIIPLVLFLIYFFISILVSTILTKSIIKDAKKSALISEAKTNATEIKNNCLVSRAKGYNAECDFYFDAQDSSIKNYYGDVVCNIPSSHFIKKLLTDEYGNIVKYEECDDDGCAVFGKDESNPSWEYEAKKRK